jgi:hypothetical protein
METQKTAIFVLTSVRTSNPIFLPSKIQRNEKHKTITVLIVLCGYKIKQLMYVEGHYIMNFMGYIVIT